MEYGSRSEPAIAKMFDRIANHYDFLNRLLSARQDLRWRRMLVSWLGERDAGQLLDVACGTGDVIYSLAEAEKGFSRFTGIDISENMLALAAKKLAGLKADVKLHAMSAEELKFSDQQFDASTISFGLRNFVNPSKALSEIHRVLKPESPLLILDFFPNSKKLTGRLFNLYFSHILPHIAGLFSDKSAYQYLPASVKGFYQLDELVEVLEKIGFKPTRKRHFLFGTCILIEAIKVS